MSQSRSIFSFLLLPVDYLMLLVAGLITYFLRTEILDFFRPVMFALELPFSEFMLISAITGLFFVAAFAVSGLYDVRTRYRAYEEFLKVLVASAAGLMGVIVYIFLRQELFNSRFLVLGGWFFALVFVLLGRFLVRRLERYLAAKKEYGVTKAMVIGDDDLTEKLKAEIESLQYGYRIVKHLINPDIAEIKMAIGNPGVDEVLLANPNYPQDKVLELVDFCHENHLSFKFVPNLFQILTTNATFEAIGSVPLVELRRTALDGWGRVAKRIMDIISAATGLAILSPVFAIISFAVKWDSEGPLLVRLKRVSRNKEFHLLKFRSMIKNAEALKPLLTELNERKDGPLFKIKDDPRITTVGKWLRRYRMDELPQFWNVLMGDISLVGPRSHQPDEIANYQKHHKKLLAIKAGATGLAQVSGSSDLPFDEEATIDSYYIENWSLWLDIKIILRTMLKMFFDRSAV